MKLFNSYLPLLVAHLVVSAFVLYAIQQEMSPPRAVIAGMAGILLALGVMGYGLMKKGQPLLAWGFTVGFMLNGLATTYFMLHSNR